MLNYFCMLTGNEDAMVKGLKVILTTTVLLIILILAGCGDSSNPTGHVTITEKSMYWEVYIDYSSGDRYSIGWEYATIVLSRVPSYEAGIDAYLKAASSNRQEIYEVFIQRALEISKNIQSRYMDEIEGFASVLSGGTVNKMGDGKLSRDEYLFANFIPSVCNETACSATAVFGNRSATGQTIVGRNTDWSSGPPQESSNGNTSGVNTAAVNTNAVIYSKMAENQVVFFGNLGVMGAIVGINSDGIFVAGLHSQTGSTYSAVGKRSVLLDIRNALETSNTVDEAGAFLGNPSRLYAYHNNMFIADKNMAKVLENDYERNRALRGVDSALNPGVAWGVSDAIACVNAFVLKGNFDNFTGQKWQTNRWANFNTMLPQEGDAVDIDRVRTIMSYHKPGAGGMDPGDIFNAGTIQSMAYSFSENRLELWLGTFVDDPQYVTIPIPFLEGQ